VVYRDVPLPVGPKTGGNGQQDEGKNYNGNQDAKWIATDVWVN